jgi:radical SAM protein with 4Fe4S-binding SPASM domain
MRVARGFVVDVHFEDRPVIAIWETTQACDLACVHCRACAQPARDARELDTARAKALLDRFAAARVPLVVLTGGDPAKRDDLVELVAHGRSLGLSMGLTPSATPLVTRDLVGRLADAQLSRLAISIDGADAAAHDVMRGVAGSFAESLRILAAARGAGIRTQINTTIHADNIGELARMAALVASLDAVLWSVFYVVPTGRAGLSMMPSAEAVEDSLHELCAIAVRAPFAVKTTEAPHYRRVAQQSGERRLRGRASAAVNDGKGFVFVSHRGEIFPSGFLPVRCGNVCTDDVIEVYRYHPVFRALRDPLALEGRCGACEYREICGGSRSRAYAVTGRMLGSDPLCAWQGTTGARRLPVVPS